ncbi:MAG: ZIP family metal transporter [Halosimplex sp.]
MGINGSFDFNNWASGFSLVGAAGVALLLVLSVVAAATGVWTVLVVGWVAFAAMSTGAYLGGRADETDPQRLVWGYGLASGAMVTSAAMFLVPQAIGIGRAAGAPQIGGIGIAAGIVVGYSAHVVGHRLTHLDWPMDVTTAQITAHALSAGLIIGLVYGSMPGLGPLLGLAIVSHKGPAGYAAARRLRRTGKPVSALLLPAAGVGIAAIPTASLPVPDIAALNAVVFGFAAGIFLHVAMDFLPVCEAGSEIDEVCSLHEHSHDLLDRLRLHAVGSTVVGAVAVVAAWVAVSP